jgi:hypothetical protein
MYLKIDNFVAKFGGPVNKKSLPWTTLVDYVKVTQGSSVIFEDEFDPTPTYKSLQPVLMNPPSSNRLDKTLGLRNFERWLLWVLVVFLVIAFAIFTFSFSGRRTNVGNGS